MSSFEEIPRYAQIETILAEEIAGRRLACGQQLPPEDQLVERFGASRTTVRKAIENLVARGLVEIRRGKGTFVSEPKITQELTELRGFAEDMVLLGRHPTARLLSKERVPAPKDVATYLELSQGAQVWRIERVRLGDGVPMSFDETYLPLEIGEKVVANDLEAEPIFDLLERKYGLPLIEARYQLEATTADARVAAGLNIEAGSSIFLIERTCYVERNRPVDYEKLYYRGDLIRFSTRLSRRPRS
ncbi:MULTISPECIES: GntR family transcriptional regulator [unclassified Rhizobium]|jgi:GntR family transcriptional regulator|uniref:GntR family transcriptional regulator n=1 Tax=unclassified Rhizobium TaxID=2613769 RepID=UPI000645E3CB|nr:MULTISPECIES: GntR family transcriptional regulator [unclassified Rhizobium]MBN8954604.1 GntR family transcriptional regulator [Rhizobium tropici]OJY68044.1 MAG: GntR family transcriptional regulator [Rhizobium sp. 60-20]